MANSTINTSTPSLPTQFDDNAAYSIGDSGNVEKKGFLGQVWTSIKTLFSSGRQSVATENQQVLLALNNSLRDRGVDDAKFASFIGQLDNAVNTGNRAITGGDIKSLLNMASETVELARSADRLFGTVMQDIAGNATSIISESPTVLGRGDVECNQSQALAISFMRHMPGDRLLSSMETRRLGANIAGHLACVDLSNISEQEIQVFVNNSLLEMNSSEVRNLCQDFADGLISPRHSDRGTSEGRRFNVAGNIANVMAETRNALMALRTAGSANMSQGGPASMDVPAAGLAPLDDRGQHIAGLLGGANEAFLSQCDLELNVDTFHAAVSSYVNELGDNIDSVESFIRSNSPAEKSIRTLAGSTISPFITDLINLGGQQITLTNGQTSSLLDLAKNIKNLTPPAIQKEAKMAILDSLSTMYNGKPQALNDMRNMLTQLKSEVEGALREANPDISQKTINSRINETVITILLSQSATVIDGIAASGQQDRPALNLHSLVYSNILVPGINNNHEEVMDFLSSIM
ncbi:MAG: hypothetical protein LBP92_09885 [Deltaproteobacteria bacterium]|jgi:hypothetical protein|nr:hypothetical protein [Deltaproteobacteria bacterium]